MVRPRKPRFCSCSPYSVYYKPRGVPLRNLEEIVLEPDEIEALKLRNIDNYDQIKAAKIMQISQPTFGRILHSANKKISQALILGKAIRLKPQK